MFLLRWGIAVGGIWWVIANMNLHDQVLVLDENNIPHRATLSQRALENSPVFEIFDPAAGQKRIVKRDQVVNPPDPKKNHLTTSTPNGPQTVRLLGLDLSDDLRQVERLLIEDPETHKKITAEEKQRLMQIMEQRLFYSTIKDLMDPVSKIILDKDAKDVQIYQNTANGPTPMQPQR